MHKDQLLTLMRKIKTPKQLNRDTFETFYANRYTRNTHTEIVL